MWAWISTAGSAASPHTAGMPSLAQLLDDLAVLLGHHERHAALGQRLGDAPPDPAVAHQHHLAGAAARVGTDIGSSASGSSRALELARASAERLPIQRSQRLDRAEHQRIERDRDERAGQDQALPLGRQQPERHAQRRPG